jgi:FkbM family methyltransferase
MNNCFKSFKVDFNFSNKENLKLPAFRWFVSLFRQEKWEKDTFNVFEKNKCKNSVAVDIGAWIGPTTIWLSNNFKNVISIEADPIALEVLKINVKASNCTNVDIIGKPLYRENKKIIFGLNAHNTTLASEGLGNSSSQIQAKNIISTDTDIEIDSITLYNILEHKHSNNISFIKVDIEGGEENILDQLIDISEDKKWKVFLSFHYDWWSNKNIDDFANSFKKCKKIKLYDNDETINISELISHIKSNPFCSIYMEF